MNSYLALAEFVLVVHVLFILWVIGGVPLVRRYPSLEWIHIGSLLYCIFIEVAPWPPCPLTILEQILVDHAGLVAFQGSFLLHYLDALVYPDVSWRLVASVAVVICVANLGYYVFQSRIADRLRRRWRGRES